MDTSARRQRRERKGRDGDDGLADHGVRTLLGADSAIPPFLWFPHSCVYSRWGKGMEGRLHQFSGLDLESQNPRELPR